MHEKTWPEVGQSWAANLQIFGEAPEFMVRYEHVSPPGAQRLLTRMAEFIRFEGDKIAEIEVFIGCEMAKE